MQSQIRRDSLFNSNTSPKILEERFIKIFVHNKTFEKYILINTRSAARTPSGSPRDVNESAAGGKRTGCKRAEGPLHYNYLSESLIVVLVED